jgi:hypothetical protein
MSRIVCQITMVDWNLEGGCGAALWLLTGGLIYTDMAISCITRFKHTPLEDDINQSTVNWSQQVGFSLMSIKRFRTLSTCGWTHDIAVTRFLLLNHASEATMFLTKLQQDPDSPLTQDHNIEKHITLYM